MKVSRETIEEETLRVIKQSLLNLFPIFLSKKSNSLLEIYTKSNSLFRLPLEEPTSISWLPLVGLDDDRSLCFFVTVTIYDDKS